MSEFQDMIDSLNMVYLMNQKQPLTEREKALARAPFLWKNNNMNDFIDDMRNSDRYDARTAAEAYDLLFENMFE